ncbi:uncharacterized protein N7515_007847 [Penicillium bovifimosum]|uniref:Uncharacterized protein n=1 Tax=Penicillium bovifimosum TaxID=126998 RepID=A0A9W9GN15_9EURO|nr:uncharacterized protein N7515_007847 [Penicillium bovifimosum]KAJ5124022.1 hypothetical protein N7515_007847 [Penicillium bovifimosum]
MPWDYRSLYSTTPRSFLFAVVANVGPGGASRALTVAYRQYHDRYNEFEASGARVHHMVTDTLALIEILSDPANRALLEAERALVEDWYRRSPHEPSVHERPSIPDTAQPPYVPSFEDEVPVQQQPRLPWREDTLSQFPFTATCVLLALLRDDSAADATRPGDVQFQPLSTVFRADCTEYGLVVLDISELDSGVQYGIAAFPVHYMATVWDPDENIDWDPVEDDQPEEVDIVLESSRPRVLLSIAQWIRKYYSLWGLEDHPGILRLEERPLADAAALDCTSVHASADGGILDIWPPELEDPPRPTSTGILSSILKVDESPRNRSIDHAKDDGSTAVASSVTTSHEPLQNVPVDMDRTIDNLLVLTREPVSPPREKQALAHLQMLAPFRQKLLQRLEEVPDRLGPSTISSHVLRVAYTEHCHLNWVVFGSLPPRVIAAAIASDELGGASALSLCVDAWAGDEEEGASDLVDLAAALAQCAGLQQLCFLQRPDRDKDDVSSRVCSQLLRLWGREPGGEDWEWLRRKTIHSTSAFLTGLRNRKLPTSSLMIASGSSFTSRAQIFPRIHLYTLLGPQREDIPNAAAEHHVHPSRPGYIAYYSMENTGLTAENFAVRFLEYLWSMGPYSDPDKAILRMAYHGAFSSLASDDDDSEQYRRKHGWSLPGRPPPLSPLRPSPDRLGVRPIPAGFSDAGLAPDDPSKVRLGDIPPRSWVVLVDRQDRSCRPSDGTAFLQYSFMKIRQACAEIAPEQQSSLVEMVGGLTNFLRETVPGIDIATWEKRVEEVERERCIDVGVMAESRAYTLLDQLV